jgi:hypothetical protein
MTRTTKVLTKLAAIEIVRIKAGAQNDQARTRLPGLTAVPFRTDGNAFAPHLRFVPSNVNQMLSAARLLAVRACRTSPLTRVRGACRASRHPLGETPISSCAFRKSWLNE